MKFPYLITTIFLILLSSCSDPYTYWDVSHFNMNENILAEQEKVTLIYSSRGPDKAEVDFYIHLVVVSKESGDTVNILSPFSNRFTQKDADKVFKFSGKESMALKAIQEIQNEDILKDVDLNNVSFVKYDKVARDPKFDFIADNDFPTTIGIIGDMFFK